MVGLAPHVTPAQADDGLLNLAISKDMLIIVDSIAELERIAELAKTKEQRTRVMLRVIGFSLERVTSSAIFIAGEWSKFGILISDIPALLPPDDGQGARLPYPYRQPDQRPRRLLALAWQAHRSRRPAEGWRSLREDHRRDAQSHQPLGW